MKTTFRFLDVLQAYDSSIKTPGLITRIVKWSEKWEKKGSGRRKLERHKLSRVLRQADTSISFEMLNCLCDFLIEEIGVPAHRLPSELFGAKKENLIELICSNANATFFVGTRQAEEWGNIPYVVATDEKLRIELTRLAMQHAGLRPSKASSFSIPDTILIPAPTRHVRSSKKSTEWNRIAKLGSDEYQRFLGHKNWTLIATGSTKVNTVVEQVLASTFGETAYKSPGKKERRVPIFFRYRESREFDDPQPPSCCGGLEIEEGVKSDEPGIYFLQNDTCSWECVCCDDRTQDAAFLVYAQSDQNRIELACGGFSARSTHLLAESFSELLGEFWPPQVNLDARKVGVFLVRFRHQPLSKRTRNTFKFLEASDAEVIRVDDDVVKERVKGAE